MLHHPAVTAMALLPLAAPPQRRTHGRAVSSATCS